MKKRIISGAVCGVVLAIALVMVNTPVLNILAAVLSVIAMLELALAMKTAGNRLLLAVNILFAAILPLTALSEDRAVFALTLMLYIVAAFIVVIAKHNFQGMSRTLATIGCSVFYVLCFYSVILLRDFYKIGSDMDAVQSDGIFFLLIAFTAAWGSDIGAYFTGTFLGRHKLCKNVSSAKTVEGLIGGVVSAVLISFIVAALYKVWAVVEVARINYLALALTVGVTSLVSVVGDLFASCIKRAGGIKDFGDIIPGHGGILDRFDSMALTVPFTYVLLQWVHIIYRF